MNSTRVLHTSTTDNYVPMINVICISSFYLKQDVWLAIGAGEGDGAHEELVIGRNDDL